MNMNDFQIEQLNALSQARVGIDRLDPSALSELRFEIAEYRDFRGRVDNFLKRHFSDRCTLACYQNHRSACCAKDGIIVFWADVVINALCSDREEMAAIAAAIQHPLNPHRCVFLGAEGCKWRIRPLVCAMFLCDEVHQTVIGGDNDLGPQWESLQYEAKGFRWPDRPVLFDFLERRFMERGCQSSLMYLNNSPGLLRVKRLAGLIER
jgi:hypothetical protein